MCKAERDGEKKPSSAYVIERIEPSSSRVLEVAPQVLDVISEWPSPPSASNLVAVTRATDDAAADNDGDETITKKAKRNDDAAVDDDKDNDDGTRP